MAVLANRAWMSVTGTPGTGTVTLNAALANYLSFAAAGITNAQVVTYEIIEPGVGWEIGRGTHTTAGTTLSRDTVLITSAGNQTKLSFTAAATVMITAAAEDIQSDVSITGGSITGISGAFYLLASSAVAISHTGTVAETTLATIVVPANAMGANGALRITMGVSCTNNANSKTPRIKFGGTTFDQPAVVSFRSAMRFVQISNRGATNSQVAASDQVGTSFGMSGIAPITGAIDTTTSQNITITGQLANAGDNLTIEWYCIEILKKA